jgi:molybdopterin synthase catalytic subunit
MKTELIINHDPIDEAALVAQRQMSPGMGAVICFVGVVRGTEENTSIHALEYEAFEKMARHQFEKIFAQMKSRWPVESIRLVHRLGVVKVNEPSLWVEVIAPHRGEAFAACQFVIEELKKVVPIWKRPIPEL